MFFILTLRYHSLLSHKSSSLSSQTDTENMGFEYKASSPQSNFISCMRANSYTSVKGNINTVAQIHQQAPNCLHAILKDGWVKGIKSTMWRKKKKNGRALTFSLRGLMGPAEGWLHLVTPFSKQDTSPRTSRGMV